MRELAITHDGAPSIGYMTKPPLIAALKSLRSMMATRFRLSARTLRVLGITTAIAVSGFTVSQASYSAFSAQTANAGNSWSTASAVFTNNKATGAFHAANIDSGYAKMSGFNFTYAGPTDHKKDLRMYTAKTVGADSEMAKYITVDIWSQQLAITTHKTKIYSGTLADLLKKDTYDKGVLIDTSNDPVGDLKYDPPYSGSPSYPDLSINVQLSPNAPNSVMGQTVSTDVVFEMKDATD